MTRFFRALKADIKFQLRQGFYLIYIILAVIYIISIYQVGDKAAVILIPILIYFDPAMVGFMFTGGLVMLERQQGITGYLGITPVTTIEYIAAKSISMVILALFTSILIVISSGKTFNVIVLVSGVILVSFFNSLLGFSASARCRTMNDYFIRMIPYMLLIILPAIGFLNKAWAVPFRFFPGYAGLHLVLSSFQNGVTASPLFDYSILILWCLIIVIPIIRKIDRYMIRG